jgi:RNA polymerase sigma-70 factor, ECF subfamily
MDTTSDEALIGRIAAGDKAAMQALFQRYQIKVYRFVLRLVRNEATAEDLISDVFLDVWRQADQFAGRSTGSTWLLRIARFKALTVLRKRPVDELDDEMMAAIPDDADDAEVTMQKKDKAGIMRDCLRALSADHREIIDLVYYHEKTVSEVAEILDIPEATVKTRMFYARKKLGDALRSHGVEQGWP